MATTVSVNARVTPEVKAKLHAIATAAQSSEESLIREAIEQFVDLRDWQATLIEQRLAESRAGGDTVEHEEVEQWLDSKAAGRQLPMPGRRT